MIQVRRVETPQDWKLFHSFKRTRGVATRTPPAFWDVNENPFFRHADLFAFLAFEGGKTVGRLAAVIDEHAPQGKHPDTVRLHALESLSNAASAALVQAARSWGQARGMLRLQGTSDSLPPLGFRRLQASYLYTGEHAHLRFSDRLLAQAERIRQRGAFTLRPLNFRHPETELALLHQIYCSGWEGQPTFVPPTLDEVRFLYQRWKPRLDLDLSWVILHRGKPIGFSIALGKGSRWLPLGLRKRWQHNSHLQIPLLGFRREYRHYSLGPWVYSEYLNRAPAQGYLAVEAGPVLEEHPAMVNALEEMGLQRSQTWHIYQMEIPRR